MRVIFLIRGGDVKPEEAEANHKAWGAYMDELKAHGSYKEGFPFAGGKVVTSGGTEDYKSSNMDVSGYFELEVDTMDNAVKAAEMAPNIKHGGSIEIREEMEMKM